MAEKTGFDGPLYQRGISASEMPGVLVAQMRADGYENPPRATDMRATREEIADKVNKTVKE